MIFKTMDRREWIFFWITFFITCAVLYDPLYAQGKWKPIITIPLILACSTVTSILATIFTRGTDQAFQGIVKKGSQRID